MENNVLKEKVDSLRNRISELLLDEGSVKSEEVMELSRELDELINNYYYHKKKE